MRQKKGIGYGVIASRNSNVRKGRHFVGEVAYLSCLITTVWWLKTTHIIPVFRGQRSRHHSAEASVLCSTRLQGKSWLDCIPFRAQGSLPNTFGCLNSGQCGENGTLSTCGSVGPSQRNYNRLLALLTGCLPCLIYTTECQTEAPGTRIATWHLSLRAAISKLSLGTLALTEV